MNKKEPGASDSFSNMGIPLAGETDGAPGDPDAGGVAGRDTRLEPLDLDGEIGDVADGLRLISHSAYATADGAGLSLLIENEGPRAFEAVEASVRLDGGGTVGEFTATSETELDRLDPGDRWRFWVPFGDAMPDAPTRYTIDLGAT